MVSYAYSRYVNVCPRRKKKRGGGGRYKRERERRGEGEWFHWPLECASNIFRVCSGEKPLLACICPGLCVQRVPPLPAARCRQSASCQEREEGGGAPVTSAPEPQLHFADERVPAVLHPKRAKKKKNEINKYIHKKPRTMQGSSH